MNGKAVAFVAGAAIIVGLFVASKDNIEADQRNREIREACMVVGAVAPDCPGLFPDVEICVTEDCSDIRGNVGYWIDPADRRQVYLTARPGMAEAPQKPDQP